MTELKYIFVTAVEPEEFEEKCNEVLKQGYNPIGSPFIRPEFRSFDGESGLRVTNYPLICQAFI